MLLVIGCTFALATRFKTSKVMAVGGLIRYLRNVATIGRAANLHLEQLPETSTAVQQITNMLVNRPNMTKHFIPKIFVSVSNAALSFQRDSETGSYINRVGHEYQFKICDGANVVGLLGTKVMGVRGESPGKFVFSASYFIDQNHWGKGFATQAVKSFISSCVAHKDPDERLKFIFELGGNNTVSLRVFLKIDN